MKPPAPDPHAIPQNADKPNYILTEADKYLDNVYGDHVHSNDGSHLTGGISSDILWEHYWKQLCSYPENLYRLPTSGNATTRFFTTLASLIEGVTKRKHNWNKVDVFVLVMLQKTEKIKGNKAIRKRLTDRLNDWDDGKFTMLVNDTIADLKHSLKKKRSGSTEESRLRRFNQLMNQGEIRKAVRYITDREQHSVLHPHEQDTNPKNHGKTVLEALQDKHPEHKCNIDVSGLPVYKNVPAIPKHQVPQETVVMAAKKLHGASGLGGVDSPMLKTWLLRYKQSSVKLQQAIATFAQWIANEIVPWAAIRSLMANRLVALDKNPGVRPIGIGSSWRRLLAKILLLLAGESATEACGADQVCAGLQSGIEGAIHAAAAVWKEHANEPEFGFLCVDARNAFNELNRTTMLWVVRHEWPAGCVFTFNCYRHYARLVIRENSGKAVTIFSRAGVTQGDPISMILYGVTTTPLIRKLKHRNKNLIHIWYADDGNVGGKFKDIKHYWQQLEKLGPTYGYYPERAKSKIITHYTKENIESAERIFKGLFKRSNITTGERFLGGYIGRNQLFEPWLQSKISSWVSSVNNLRPACKLYPQAAYCGLQKSLQMEWQFLQRVCKCPADSFKPLEQAIADFISSLFQHPPPPRQLTSLPVKSAGLSLPNPTTTAQQNYAASIKITNDLVKSIRNRQIFSLLEHSKTASDAKHYMKTERHETNQNQFDAILDEPSFLQRLPDEISQPEKEKAFQQRLLKRATKTGNWLTTMPLTSIQTNLSASEFRDNLHIRYGMTPRDLPEKCDGCSGRFSMYHAFTCRKDGFLIHRHNEIQRELADLAAAAFTPMAIRHEPKINATGDETNNNRGDILIRGFYQNATDCIIDVSNHYLDSLTYYETDPHQVLKEKENVKKRKYLKDCLAQRRSFVPFCSSIDGMLGEEATSILKVIATKLSQKWSQPYSQTSGYVKARMAIAIARSAHRCIRGSRISYKKISSERYEWDCNEGTYFLHSYSTFMYD